MFSFKSDLFHTLEDLNLFSLGTGELRKEPFFLTHGILLPVSENAFFAAFNCLSTETQITVYHVLLN